MRREVERAGELADAGKFTEAGERLSALLAEYPDFCVALFNYGELLVRQGRDEEALPWFIRVLKRETGAVDALVEIGLIHYRAGRFAEAETVFRDALCADKNDARVLNNLGVLSFVQERFRDAQKFFSQAVDIEPDNDDYAVNLRDTLAELKKNN